MTEIEVITAANDSGLTLYGMGKDRAKFLHHLQAFAALVEAEVRAKLEKTEQDNTYVYASSLATAIWQKHYMKESPKFALLDTTEGVLTQIDNMTCGLAREKPAQPAQERNFCPRCGKRTRDLTTIHTCTPPQEKNT